MKRLRQRHNFRDYRIRTIVFARAEFVRIRVGDQLSIVIDDENRSSAHAGVLQPLQNWFERNYRGQHTAEFVLIHQGNRDDECSFVVRRECQRIAAKLHKIGG